MDLLRESTIGHIIRFLSKDRVLRYPDEQAKFEQALQNGDAGRPRETKVTAEGVAGTEDIESTSSTHSGEDRPMPPLSTKPSTGVVLVRWYSLDDAENPQNWGNGKRYFVGLLIWSVLI